jgi:MFS family permease
VVRKVVAGIAGRHWIIVLASVRCLAGGLLYVGLPVKLDGLGWTEWDLGNRAAVGAGTYALTCWMLCLVVHRLPTRLVMVLSCVLSGAAALGLAAAEAMWAVYALSVLSSFATAFFWVPLMAWIGESDDEHLVGDMAAFNCAWMGALAVGSLTGGLAEAAWSGLSLYLLAGVLFLLAFIAPLAHIRGQQASTGAPEPSPDAGRLPRRYLLAGWVAALLSMLAVGVPQAIFVKLHSALLYGAATYGVFWGVQSVARVAVAVSLAAFGGWRYRWWPLAVSLLLAAAGSVLLAVAGSKGVFALGFFLLGAGAGMGYWLGFYYSVHGRRNRKRNAAMFEGVIVSQSIVAGPLGGGVATHFGRRAPYAVTAALAVLAAVRVFLWLRRTARAKKE